MTHSEVCRYALLVKFLYIQSITAPNRSEESRLSVLSIEHFVIRIQATPIFIILQYCRSKSWYQFSILLTFASKNVADQTRKMTILQTLPTEKYGI
jgi:hypothetical protein